MKIIPQFRFTKDRGFRCPIFRLPKRNVYGKDGDIVMWSWWRIILVWE